MRMTRIVSLLVPALLTQACGDAPTTLDTTVLADSRVPAGVAFTTQPPVRVEGNVVISPPVQVTVRDASGNAVPHAVVRVAVDASPWGEAKLRGTTVVRAENGVASFADLRIDRPGQGYTLRATSASVSAASAPFAVGLTFQAVDAGDFDTCGLTPGGTYCWGNWYAGADTVPHLIDGPAFVEISSGRFHTCGRTSAGEVYCWGFNQLGELGDGTFTDRPVPVLVSGGLTFASVSAGGFHTCGLVSSGAAYCWGGGGAGDLGNAADTNSAAPVAVAGGLTFRSLSAGLSHTCAVTPADQAYCWGSGFAGELGNDAVAIGDTRNTPVTVSGGLSFSTVSAGFNISCGVSTSQIGYCWGNGEGGVGDGKFQVEMTPAAVVDGLSFTAISAARSHSCGLVTTAPGIQCWGANNTGQVGDGTTQPRLSGVLIDAGATPSVITVAETHSCALTASGLLCWGANDEGQIGDGTRVQRTVPTRVVQ
jgi:hypothetical protein